MNLRNEVRQRNEQITGDELENMEENEEEELRENVHEEEIGEALRRSTRNRKPPVWVEDYEMTASCGKKEDLRSEEWQEAIRSEIKAHLKNGTWKIIEKKNVQNVIGCKMILKKKYKANGELERRKARLVAKGFAQLPEVDFHETFAPVAKLIRLLVGIAVEENMSVKQFDVSTAFLNGDLEEEIFMEKPKYLETYLNDIILEESENPDKSLYRKAKQMLEDIRKGKNEKICLLRKALYGLKQAGRQWFQKLDNRLKELGFNPSTADPCIYSSGKGRDRTIIAIYVDDILAASNNQNNLDKLGKNLEEAFEIRNLGNLHYCLGIKFQKENNKMKLSQEKYIEDVLKKFDMSECKPVATPMETGLKLTKTTIEELYPYQNLIGSLMYLSVATRPDIAHAVSYLSQFNTCFGKEHWIAAKRVLRYLQGTKQLALTFKKTGKKLYGLADADWASCTLDRRSYTGYVFKYAGAPISWESRKQKTVALSTAEAEYMSLTEAAKEAIHLKTLLAEVDVQQEAVMIFNDNQAAQHLSQNPVVNSKSKHINIREHFIREVVKQGNIKLAYQKTEDMDADLLTKPIGRQKFSYLRSKLGLIG